jgi:hypothetical protein
MGRVVMSSLFFVILFLCQWTSLSEAEYLKYKDPKQSLGARIKDLLSRMTLAEKIGQMTQIDRSVASTDVMKDYMIGNTNSFHVLVKFAGFVTDRIQVQEMISDVYVHRKCIEWWRKCPGTTGVTRAVD